VTEPTVPPRLKDVIAQHGLAAQHGLGQHFLLDYNLTRRIAAAAGDLAGANVIEVGPGPGGLTWALLETQANQVYAIARDRRCIAPLEAISDQWSGRLTIIEADALTLDLETLCPAPRHIVANLPYNISTKLLVNWVSNAAAFENMILMFQREVAARLVAGPGSKAYGRLSVLTQWLCETRALFDIGPRAFTPPPKVASTVVALTPRPEPAFPASLPVLERVTAAAFGQRRKMLRSSLKQISPDPIGLLTETKIEPTARAEEIDIEGFCRLARAVEAAG
jgi:16S rRNA (adenine1518-N6/adenine1519-N6)-dimethyltransferase